MAGEETATHMFGEIVSAYRGCSVPVENELVHHRLQQHSITRPDAVAITRGSSTFTFGEINGLANYVAGRLLDLNGNKNELIGVLSANPASQLIFSIGAWKAGMIALILEASDPKARLNQILHNADVDIVITDVESANWSLNTEHAPFSLDLNPQHAQVANLDVAYEPDSPAVVVYTSGSSGEPKGVVRSHRNLLHQIDSDKNYYQLGATDRIAQLLPLNFSSGLRNALNSLLSGANLLFYDIQTKGISSFPDWIQNQRITILPAPVAFFRRFLSTALTGTALTTCRYVILNGEKLYKRDIENFRRIFGTDCKLVHTFGSTETGIIARHCIGRAAPVSDPVAVGIPEKNLEVRIVDDNGQSKPPGRMGEIVVVGSNLPSGYWQDPALTERKYKNLPRDKHRRMYLTGDIGTIGTDGLLYHHSRIDNQTKVRGYRVDVSEIEAVLNNVEGVVHGVVMVSESSAGDKELTAYVSLAAGSEMRPEMLREIAASKLPGYMMPDHVEIIDQIPITARGKVDRQSLMSNKPTAVREVSTKPVTDTERKIIQTWEEVFGMQNISPLDDILDLGVNSLNAMVMCLQLGRFFSIEIPFSQLILTPTATELAAFIDAKKSACTT